MAYHLPFVMQQLLNTPLALADRSADMLVAALAGRLNIGSLEGATSRMDARALADHAAMGRAVADARAVEKSTGISADAQQAGSKRGRSFLHADNVAIIQVYGTLTRTWGVGPYSGSTGYDGIKIQLLDAMDDDDIDAIWLDIDSGGGAVNGLFDLVDVIWSLNGKNGGKPIWAMAADYAYSAAYALGTAADKFYVPRTGGVGSVGVITLHVDETKALEEEGLKVTVIRSGARKAKGNSVEALDDETRAHIQAQCDEVRQVFIDTVARNMGLSKKTVSETEALDYMGHAAKAIGFVSDVLSEQEAWAKLQRKIKR